MTKRPDLPATSLTPWLAMIVSPLFFASNLVLGRFTTGDVAPFLLATLRWGAVALLLSPLLLAGRATVGPLIRRAWPQLAVLGFLSMGICGGGIYFALRYTTATNATLIYTTSPVLILLLERIFMGRRSHPREIAGMTIAFAGVVTIIFRGSLEAALSLSFNPGDVIVFAAALSWAGYSILYRVAPIGQLGNMPALGLIAIFGALANLPVAGFEVLNGGALPSSPATWLIIAGIVIGPSLLAYTTFQLGVRAFGPSVAGVFMYLLPPYGVGLSVLFLGEDLQPFHAAGIALVMAGIIIATFPAALLARIRPARRP